MFWRANSPFRGTSDFDVHLGPTIVWKNTPASRSRKWWFRQVTPALVCLALVGRKKPKHVLEVGRKHWRKVTSNEEKHQSNKWRKAASKQQHKPGYEIIAQDPVWYPLASSQHLRWWEIVCSLSHWEVMSRLIHFQENISQMDDFYKQIVNIRFR